MSDQTALEAENKKLKWQLENIEKIAADTLLNCKPDRERIAELSKGIKFLYAFAPGKPDAELDPTCYHTLSYLGDLKLWERIEGIKALAEG
jgi:hypothetical protein